MVRSTKFKRDLEIAADPYQRIVDEIKKQLSITMFFKKDAQDSPFISCKLVCKNMNYFTVSTTCKFTKTNSMVLEKRNEL
ncbi:hypothetical protein T10_13313 [Trichinella papuae]|uniref:Uncharacterized protein n=1 Tax=Trichinella papuae TaxID=268474 RepID=A0A0V1MF71_9BILA|nr:hypothetical protein T10_13313 [Trichinella papuae]